MEFKVGAYFENPQVMKNKMRKKIFLTSNTYVGMHFSNIQYLLYKFLLQSVLWKYLKSPKCRFFFQTEKKTFGCSGMLNAIGTRVIFAM